MTISRAWGACPANPSTSLDPSMMLSLTQPALTALLCPVLCIPVQTSDLSDVSCRLASYIHTSMFLPALFGRPRALVL